LQTGKKNRSVGATAMNQDSSRSHSIFTITIEMTEKYDEAAAATLAKMGKDDSHIRVRAHGRLFQHACARTLWV
jgi:hypothetical protein